MSSRDNFDGYGLRSFGDYRDIADNLEKIRRVIGPDTLIEFHCYNKSEVDNTARLLSTEERKQVRFFWLTWPRSKRGSP